MFLSTEVVNGNKEQHSNDSNFSPDPHMTMLSFYHLPLLTPPALDLLLQSLGPKSVLRLADTASSCHAGAVNNSLALKFVII